MSNSQKRFQQHNKEDQPSRADDNLSKRQKQHRQDYDPYQYKSRDNDHKDDYDADYDPNKYKPQSGQKTAKFSKEIKGGSKWVSIIVIIIIIAIAYFIISGLGKNADQTGVADSTPVDSQDQEQLITDFWQWFEQNQKELFEYEENEEAMYYQLNQKLTAIHPDLSFEFGRVDFDGKREFTISASGIKDAIPAVEAVYDQAPNLEKWEFIKYKQPQDLTDLEITYGNQIIYPEDVYYNLFEDDGKTGIVLYFSDYDPDYKQDFINLSFILLDAALGEYTVMTEIGFVDVKSTLDRQAQNAFPLTKLPIEFDL